ncbi:MAG: HDOD domain-containing protein [Armatimonadetes bacterium]|nr:HDOD domain-containing protein [Armatimonadota bacterium]
MSALPHDRSEQALGDILSKQNDLAVLPQVVFKIMEMTGAESSSVTDLERAIAIDPGFSARILSQANSAHFALPKKVTSIHEAIMFVGFKSIRQLAATIGVFDMFLGKNDAESIRRRAWWRQSIDTGVAAQAIAKRINGIDSDTVYTAGLLHLIGKTVLDRYSPGDYMKVEKLLEAGAGDVQAEQAVFWLDHVMVGFAVAQRWGFPKELILSLDYCNPPQETEPCRQNRALLAVGHSIALIVRDGIHIDDAPTVLPRWAMDILGFSEEQYLPIINEGRGAIMEAARLHI